MQKKPNRLIVCRRFSPVSLVICILFCAVLFFLASLVHFGTLYEVAGKFNSSSVYGVHNALCTLHMRKLTGLPAIYHYALVIALLFVSMSRPRERKKKRKLIRCTYACTLDSMMICRKKWISRKCTHTHTQHFIDMFRFSSFSSRICAAALMQNTNRVLQFQRIFSHWLSFLACIHVLSLTFPFQYDDQIKGHTIVIKYTNKWLD